MDEIHSLLDNPLILPQAKILISFWSQKAENQKFEIEEKATIFTFSSISNFWFSFLFSSKWCLFQPLQMKFVYFVGKGFVFEKYY